MSGAGNLFVVINNLGGRFSGEDGQKLARVLCQKSEKYTAQEGLMFLESGSTQNKKGLDFKCKFFNPDGSLGMMCGNGGRVIARFAKMAGVQLLSNKQTKFEMATEIYSAEFVGENIKLFMPPPSVMPKEIDLLGVGKVMYANTGTHHVVRKTYFYHADDFKFDIEKEAVPIRNHREFAPDGVNVNFYMIENGIVHMRTFEKGVETETGACGTGAVATALVVCKDDGLQFPVHIIPKSCEELIVGIIGDYDNIEKIVLEGPATVFDENVEIEIEM